MIPILRNLNIAFSALLFLSCNSSKKLTSIDFSDGSYEGEVDSKGRKHGKGTYKWLDGSFYEGYFDKDLRQGVGLFKWSNGESYKGDYLADQRTGEGLYNWQDGSVYEGSFINGKRHGYGTFTAKDGTIYRGIWFDDLMHGKGELVRSDGSLFTGVWQAGKLLDRTLPLPVTSTKPDLNSSSIQDFDKQPEVTIVEEVSNSQENEQPQSDAKEIGKFTESLELKESNVSSIVDNGALDSAKYSTIQPQKEFGRKKANLSQPEPLEALNAEVTNETQDSSTISKPESKKFWTGTAKEVEGTFQTKLINGIDTVFDRLTNQRFTGKMKILDTAGDKKGELELVDGQMHGEELFFEEGKLVEKSLWQKGKFVKSLPLD
ncbi:MAG: hypothetical protein VX038_00725 [Verrucomicrobiota bacterium]|nr:hypothetical protein [Verrucomicrobiota bacterium]